MRRSSASAKDAKPPRRSPLVQMASSLWMPELCNTARPAASGVAALRSLTHPVMRVRPLPEHLLTGQMIALQFSPDGIPPGICRPADGS